jgi:hypothetical protein
VIKENAFQMQHTRKTVWQKLNYLRGILPGFSFRHIRYCTFSASHLIVNDMEKWAHIVHDPGTVVSSEIAFETVDYERAVDIFEDVLTGIYFEYEPMGHERKKRTKQKILPRGESYYEFIQELNNRGEL